LNHEEHEEKKKKDREEKIFFWKGFKFFYNKVLLRVLSLVFLSFKLCGSIFNL